MSLRAEAWDGDSPHSEAARQRLLEAAGRCIAREGVAAATVAAVAGEAGVSRQTVYRYFTGRHELAQAAILAAADDLRARISGRIATLTDPADMIVEALVLGLSEINDDPILRAVWDSSGHGGAIAVAFTEPTGIAWTSETLAPAIDAAGWSPPETEAAVEMILRVYLSLVISPAPVRTTEETRAFLYRHLIPGLALSGDTP